MIRFFFSATCLLLLSFPGLSYGAPAPASPSNLPTIPAVVSTVTFAVTTDGENHKMVVTPTPTLLRVDEPSDGFSIIYNARTEHYTGLELRNYTYWEFSWPEVRNAVEGSKRYETRLRELGNEGINSDSPDVDPNAPLSSGIEPGSPPAFDTNAVNTSEPAPTADSDTSGYVWRPTTDHKRILSYDCVHWVGESVSGSPVDAWCYPGLLAPVETALSQLRMINEPIALVPVRTLLPPFVFEINDALARGGVTPLLISWGDNEDKNRFELLSIKTREGKASLFTVPKLYIKTTLVTMDGMMTPVKSGPESSSAPLKPIGE